MINNCKFQNKIEFEAEHKYIKNFYMINNNETYEKFKKYIFMFACLYISCIIRLIITGIVSLDIHYFLSIIFSPFMDGHRSDLELFLEPFFFLYPTFMILKNYIKINTYGEYKLWNFRNGPRNSSIDFDKNEIVYNICGKEGKIKYIDICSCYKWKNNIFIECKNSENIIIPCKDKKERINILYSIKKKIQEETKEVYKDNVDKWSNNILGVFGFVKKSKLFLISLWINFVYFYLVGLEYESFNPLRAFVVRTYFYGNKAICYRVYEIFVVCILLTIVLRICGLIKTNKIKEEYKDAENNMDSEQ